MRSAHGGSMALGWAGAELPASAVAESALNGAVPVGRDVALAAAAEQLDARLCALVAGMVAQDEEALAAFYDLTVGRAYALALRITRNDATAEEVVEDAYFQAWREAARFDPARGRALTWLLTICRSRALDALRRRDDEELVSDPQELLADTPSADPDPLGLLEALQAGSAVRAAVARLQPQARQLVALAFFRGLTHQEIADFTGMPLGSVKTVLHRACKQMRAWMAGHEPHVDGS